MSVDGQVAILGLLVKEDSQYKGRPTGCPSAAPPRIDWDHIQADSTFQKSDDLADAQRRRLHGRVGRQPRFRALTCDFLIRFRVNLRGSLVDRLRYPFTKRWITLQGGLLSLAMHTQDVAAPVSPPEPMVPHNSLVILGNVELHDAIDKKHTAHRSVGSGK